MHEALNLAGLWKLPAIFICENNQMAMGTQVERSSAEKDLAKRGSAYAMPYVSFDGNDLDTVSQVMKEASDRGRAGEGPSFLVANTYRFRGHSMSDAMKYRTKEELERARQRDPIVMFENRLREAGVVDDKAVEAIEREVKAIVDDAVHFADTSPHPPIEEMYTDILSEHYPLQK